VPRKLQRPSATTVSSSEVELNWEEISEGDQDVTYVVEWSSECGENNVTKGIEKNFTIIDNLVSNDLHTFSIRANNPGGNGELSDAVTSITCKFMLLQLL